MVGQRKLDNRIRIQIENGVQLGHRSMFVVVGDKGRDEVVILHHILSKATFKARPNVLWCYKKDLGFSTHRKKIMRMQKKRQTSNMEDEDPFELFIASTNIRYCYYNETQKILGNTYGMCILQDFEALTPNLLARTIETVEGGGMIVFLVKGVDSLKQLYTLTMDVHNRYRTEGHEDIVGRFNERFILSLADCSPGCLVLDDNLNILPISSKSQAIEPVAPKSSDELSETDAELKELKEAMSDSKSISALLSLAKTLDQAKALLKFLDLITEKSLRQTCALTAARGRGKSAALGLSMAGAVAFGYSNIFVTSPSPENLKTLFEFVVKGLEGLGYEEHLDYELVQSTNPAFNSAIVRVNVFRDHRQTIQYIHASDSAKLGQCELLVVDEAAAIPLPLVRALLGPYLVFLSSTINGYEGTGRSLSLKLISQLRQQTAVVGETTTTKKPSGTPAEEAKKLEGVSGRTLEELELKESIRYRNGDPIERWLNTLLCLEPTAVNKIQSGCPSPSQCELYYINRDTLFCYHKASEAFLQRLMSIYVSAHYKNSPNDLQMLSDAPAHHLFCLLGPKPPGDVLPEILCIIQVCLEGEISKGSVEANFRRGKRAAGDMIPWTLAQQFQDNDFPSLSGGRIIRIATHPDYQRMGYGRRAMDLLERYYRGDIQNLMDEDDDSNDQTKKGSKKKKDGDNHDGESSLQTEKLGPRSNLPPLLSALTERTAEPLDWLGVSFGLTPDLLKFWKRQKMVPLYLRQTPNELTGEHSTIMVKALNNNSSSSSSSQNVEWLDSYWSDFRRRIVSLLGYQFRQFGTSLALSLLHNPTNTGASASKEVTREELRYWLRDGDLRRLEQYSYNMVDYHLIMDLVPNLSRIFFTYSLGGGDVKLSPAQSAILLGMGLQYKDIDGIQVELDIPTNQIMALFNKSVKKLLNHLNRICADDIERREGLNVDAGDTPVVKGMKPTEKSLKLDLEEAAKDFEADQDRQRRKMMMEDDLSEYRIKGSEDDWNSALSTKEGKKADGGKTPKGIFSVKNSDGKKRPLDASKGAEDIYEEAFKSGGKKKKNKIRSNH